MSSNFDKAIESLKSSRSFTRLLLGIREKGRKENSSDGSSQQSKSESYEDCEFSCPICLEDINYNEMAMKCPENGHFFHQTCLSEWLVHQSHPFEPPRFDQRRIVRSGTCPICRDKLTNKAAKLKTYLKDPNYMKDDRSISSKLIFKLRMYGMLFFADRKAFLRSFSGLFVFSFGAFKGFTLKSWTFTQDVVYFTLPHRLRLVTTVGYVLGLLIRACFFVYQLLKKRSVNTCSNNVLQR